MKKTIKINFQNFWEGFDPENNLFINTLRKKYSPILSKDPDFVFYSVYKKKSTTETLHKKGDFLRKISPNMYIFLKKIYSQRDILKKRKTFAPNGNFIKILYSAENEFPRMEDCDWAFGSHPEEIVRNKSYLRVAPYIIDNPNLDRNQTLPFRRTVDYKKIIEEKTKFCNFIYSQDISRRNGFFKKLRKYKKIDAPGRCMNNSPPIKNKSSRASRLSTNWVKDKLLFIKKYKFSIAFENEISPGWITEKLTHPLLVNSIPIYVGTESVREYFNEKCFINRNDFKSTKKFIQHIIEVDKNDELYLNYLSQPFFKNKRQYENSAGNEFIARLDKIIELGNRKS